MNSFTYLLQLIYTECQTMAHTFSYAELLDRTLLLQFGIITSPL